MYVNAATKRPGKDFRRVNPPVVVSYDRNKQVSVLNTELTRSKSDNQTPTYRGRAGGIRGGMQSKEVENGRVK